MSTLTRRAAIASGIGTLGGAALLRPANFAQDSATPDDSSLVGEDLIAAANEARALVEADRSTLADDIDTSGIDAAITTADELLAATATGDDTMRVALGAVAVLAAAESLILAALEPGSLPSHDAATSHILLRAHSAIEAATERVAGATDPAVTGLLDSSHAAYAAAFDAYGQASYIPAAQTASAGVQFALAVRILAGNGDVDSGERRSGTRPREGMDRERPARAWMPGVMIAAPVVRLLHPLEQVDVPAPDFGA